MLSVANLHNGAYKAILDIKPKKSSIITTQLPFNPHLREKNIIVSFSNPQIIPDLSLLENSLVEVHMVITTSEVREGCFYLNQITDRNIHLIAAILDKLLCHLLLFSNSQTYINYCLNNFILIDYLFSEDMFLASGLLSNEGILITPLEKFRRTSVSCYSLFFDILDSLEEINKKIYHEEIKFNTEREIDMYYYNNKIYYKVTPTFFVTRKWNELENKKKIILDTFLKDINLYLEKI